MRVTGLSTGARDPVLSPDGSRIAFTSSVYPGALSDADNRSQAAERLARKWKARTYDGFPIQNWDEWVGDRQSHAFVQALPAPGQGGAPARDLPLVRHFSFVSKGGRRIHRLLLLPPRVRRQQQVSVVQRDPRWAPHHVA